MDMFTPQCTSHGCAYLTRRAIIGRRYRFFFDRCLNWRRDLLMLSIAYICGFIYSCCLDFFRVICVTCIIVIFHILRCIYGPFPWRYFYCSSINILFLRRCRCCWHSLNSLFLNRYCFRWNSINGLLLGWCCCRRRNNCGCTVKDGFQQLMCCFAYIPQESTLFSNCGLFNLNIDFIHNWHVCAKHHVHLILREASFP